ncbi:recombinase family protein [Micromonospora sp. NPDC000442]|uniref:recombinase family protein n=1 Tax=Micromonospora sp. NPDC000442 TaxID=3364217 RepID=UPI00367D7747
MRPYLRVSDNKGGTSGSTVEQLGELETDASGHGWTIGEAYRDDGVSASRYGTKRRDDYDRLMADLAAGTFGAGILGLWEGSRGSRQVGEWVSLLEALEQAEVKVWVSTEERLFDPRVPGDRKALLTMAVDAEHESAKTRQRVLRSATASAVAGRPWGVLAYGYRRRYDEKTRKLVEQYEDPAEADNIRDLFQKLDDGWSLNRIAKDWAAKGVVSPGTGRPFSPAHLRQMAIKPVYAGRRKHGDKIYPAKLWEPIVDPAQWDRVNATLRDPSRKTTRAGLGIHLSTAVVRCGVCGSKMSTSERGDEPRHLRCHDRDCVQINQAIVDYLVEEAIIDALSDQQTARRPEGSDERLAEVRRELAAVKLQLADLAAAVAARRLSITLAASAEPALLADERRLEKLEVELSVPPKASRFVAPSDAEARKSWAATPMSGRRDLARELCVPGRLGVPTVLKTTDRSWCADPEHEKPVQTCIHTVERRLIWRRE